MPEAQATHGARRTRRDPGPSRAAGGVAASAEETIVLVGLSGSGKTSVGRCLAERLGRQFIDLDETIERRTGRTPADLLANDGEPAFRRHESDALTAALERQGAVIATGGGAVIDPLNRWAIWSQARAVWLDAPDDGLASRIQRDRVERPLARGGAPGLARMRAAREPFYRGADVRVDASGSLDEVTAVVAAAVAAPVRGHAACSTQRSAATTRWVRTQPVSSTAAASTWRPSRSHCRPAPRSW